jgi:uncharacterized protein
VRRLQRLWPQKGVRVALVARSQSALDAVTGAIVQAGGDARAYTADLSDGGAADAVATRIKAELGAPDIVINCAGAGQWLDIEETTPAQALQMMGAPYVAAFNLTRQFVPGMLARHSGRIVNVNSPAAFGPWPGATAYASARWALRGLTEALRVDLYGTGVGVTQVVAGEVESPYWAHNPGARERLPRLTRYFRTLAPEEVANAIVRSIEHDQATVVIPFVLRFALALSQLWPGALRRAFAATGRTRQS